DISALKAMGATGTYRGSLFGSVDNNGARYLASGGLNATYNFGTQRGSFSGINYDGRFSFSAMGKSPPTGPNYQVPFICPPTRTSRVQGAPVGPFDGPGAMKPGGTSPFTPLPNKIGAPSPFSPPAF